MSLVTPNEISGTRFMIGFNHKEGHSQLDY